MRIPIPTRVIDKKPNVVILGEYCKNIKVRVRTNGIQVNDESRLLKIKDRGYTEVCILRSDERINSVISEPGILDWMTVSIKGEVICIVILDFDYAIDEIHVNQDEFEDGLTMKKERDFENVFEDEWQFEEMLY